MISFSFGIRVVGSDIMKDWFRDLGFRTSKRIGEEAERFDYDEVDDSSVFELFYL